MCIPSVMTSAYAEDLVPSPLHTWDEWHSCESEWEQGQSGWTRIISRWLLSRAYIFTWLPRNKGD